MSWVEIKEDYAILRIKVVPNSSKNVISGILDESLKIKIKAPAVEGAANKELVKFLSKLLKLSKSDIIFMNGETSKRKLIKIPLNEKVENFIKELEKC